MTAQHRSNAPTIAALIINYNYARFVRDAIDSVLSQDPPFDEIIVVDDGSTDNSLDVISAYEPRIRVLSKTNGGQLDACIAGIAAATTDYVYTLDADDYVLPGFVNAIKDSLAVRPAKVQFQLIGVDVNKRPLGSTFPTYSEGYGARQMVADNRTIGFYLCPPTSGNVFRRDVIAGMHLELIDPRDFIDGPPALAIPHLGAVASLNEPLAHYRVHGQNHSRWDRPDAALLQREIDWFYRRWQGTCKLLGLVEPPFGAETPLYVLERQLMQSALGERPGVIRAAGRYTWRLLASHLPPKQKAILIAWASGLLLPIAGWQKKLVLARRSPLNRPAGLKQLVRLLTRHRGVHTEGQPRSTAAGD